MTNRIAVSAFGAVLACGAVAAQTVKGDVGRRVDEYLTRLTPFGFSGSVLVAVSGEIVLSKGYGLADRAGKIPYTAETVASIGSITKQFTAAAILKLEMAGKLHVSDPIGKYLPGVPEEKSAITIHHLLTHTSGIPGDLGGTDDEAIGRDALVKKVLATPLGSKPGEAFEYSNEGYSLLAAIVEIASGQSYERFLHDELFAPAGMTKTGYLLPKWAAGELAHGYERVGDGDWGLIFQRGWREDGPGWYLRGNGGIHSTIDDMYKWHVALGTNRILSAEARKKLFTPYVPTRAGDTYAYGWGIERTRRNTTVVAHNGGNGIFAADFRRYVDEDIVIIAMTNAGIPATELAPRQLDALVFGDTDVPMPPVVVSVPIAERSIVAGAYALDGGGRLTVAADGEGLRVETDDSTAYTMVARLVAPGGRFASIEARTKSIVEAAARGDFGPVVDAFAGLRTREQVQAGQGGIWQRWRSDYGEFSGVDILGTAPGGDAAVHARVRFARGAAFAVFAWGPRRLVGIRIVADMPRLALLPESAGSYVSFDYRTGSIVRAVFRRDAATTTVRLSGPNGDVTGRHVGGPRVNEN